MKFRWKKEVPYLLFLFPAFIVYTALIMWPLLQAFGLSFTDWKGYTMEGLNYVGLKNYIKILGDKEMAYEIKNTIIYAVFNPMLVTVLAVPLAVILNSKMKTKNFQRAAFFFPSVPSAWILGYLW